MKIVILDRDGVINHDSENHICTEQEWEAIPGSLDALGQFYRHGWRIVVASNQPGLAQGKFTVDDLNRIHRKMHNHAVQFGAMIDAIFFCPHGPEDGCECRKPRPGLITDIARRLRISLEGVPFIGDKRSDIEAARDAGARPVLVRTGCGARTEAGGLPAGVEVFDDLAAAAESLIAAQ